MKDAHLFAALERAVQRFGTSDLPDDPGADASRPRRSSKRGRRRTPGWVSIREIEACQPPNTYPRMGRRMIKVRCAQLAREEGGPVLEMQVAGLRTWVRFAPPAAHAAEAAGTADAAGTLDATGTAEAAGTSDAGDATAATRTPATNAATAPATTAATAGVGCAPHAPPSVHDGALAGEDAGTASGGVA